MNWTFVLKAETIVPFTPLSLLFHFSFTPLSLLFHSSFTSLSLPLHSPFFPCAEVFGEVLGEVVALLFED